MPDVELSIIETEAAPLLFLAERFGPTLQGEGPSSGQPALFIRLSRCNLDCTWCDTPYTWDWSRFDPRVESTRVSSPEILDWVEEHPTSLVVITGGEPLIQQRRLDSLVQGLVQRGRRVEFETNGTIAPLPTLCVPGVTFNVSPKLASSGVNEDRRIVPDALQSLAASGQAIFKFVVSDEDDVDEVSALQSKFSLPAVWVMPEGTSSGLITDRMRWLAEIAINRGWSLTPRLHVLLWGDERRR